MTPKLTGHSSPAPYLTAETWSDVEKSVNSITRRMTPDTIWVSFRVRNWIKFSLGGHPERS